MLVAAVVAVGLAAPLAGPASAGPAMSTVVSADRTNSVAAQLQAALDEVVAAGASGVTLRVDDGRRAYRLASGKARLDPPQRMFPQARLRVGSITKTFVSTVVLQLVAEGRLSLDDSVERWQPGLIPGGERITIRHLLNHTSGIFNYTTADFIGRVVNDPLRTWTPQELIAESNAQPPLFEPGTDWSYSNTGYIVLGLILERVTHRPVSTLIDQRIVRPLRLRDTFFPERSPEIPGYHAHGYYPLSVPDGDYYELTRISPTWAWAAGALVSNVDDLRRFYQALLGGRLLPPAQLAQMKDVVPTGQEIDYGLGLYRVETECGSFWGHDGLVPGYVTIALNDESGRRGITIGLPTEPVGEIAVPVSQLLEVALCRAGGQEPPAPAATTGVTGVMDHFRGVDQR